MDFVNFSEPARFDDLVSLLKLRHASLLRADLNDALMLVLRFDDGVPFRKIMRERLLDVDVFPGGTGINRDRDMPMIRRADQNRIDVTPFQQCVIILDCCCFRVG